MKDASENKLDFPKKIQLKSNERQKYANPTNHEHHQVAGVSKFTLYPPDPKVESRHNWESFETQKTH